MYRNDKGWTSLFYDIGAHWIHDGNMKRPHALLTGGEHTNEFFNGNLITDNPSLLKEAASDLIHLLATKGLTHKNFHGIVGPAKGATKMAKAMRDTTHPSKFWMSPNPKIVDGKKVIIFTEEEINLLPGKHVVICDDTSTTLHTVNLTAEAVLRAGGVVLCIVPVLVNRSDKKSLHGRDIIALANIHMERWSPEACPLCAGKSEAIPPKEPGNWARLNVPYEELV